MSKSTKKMPKTRAKADNKPDPNVTSTGKKVTHNRLRIDKNPSDDPVRKQRQDLYYARQEHILAHKKQYRKEIKEGKRIPVSKTAVKKTPGFKKTAKKILTEEQKHAVRLESKRNSYKNNKVNVLAYQARHREEKNAKAKAEKKKKILDEWEKLYGGG